MPTNVDSTDSTTDPNSNRDELLEIYGRLSSTKPEEFVILDSKVLNSEYYMTDANNKDKPIIFTGGNNGGNPSNGGNNNGGNNHVGTLGQKQESSNLVVVGCIGAGVTLIVVIVAGAVIKARKAKARKSVLSIIPLSADKEYVK